MRSPPLVNLPPTHSAAPVTGPIFFTLFHVSVFVFILPFFLAIINDAYSVRNAQLTMLRERVRRAQETKKAAMRLEQNERRPGKEQFDKRKYALLMKQPAPGGSRR